MRKAYLLLIFCVAVLSVACGKTADEPVSGDMVYRKMFMGHTAFGDKGFIHQSDGSIICFFDPVTNTDTPICTRADCEHRSKNSDGSACDAALANSFGMFMILAGERIYYAGKAPGHSVMEIQLWSMDLTGNDRKQLAEIDNAYQMDNIVYGNGRIALSYYTNRDSDGNDLQKWKAGITVYDIASNEVRTVFAEENYQLSCTNCWLEGDKLWYIKDWRTEPITNTEDFSYEEYFKCYKSEIRVIDLATNEDTLVIETGIDDDLSFDRDFIIFGGKNMLLDLRTGKTMELPDTGLKYRAYLEEEGYLVAFKGTAASTGTDYLVRLDGKEGETKETGGLCSVITSRYVYGLVNNEYSYIKKEDLLKGKNNWKKCNFVDKAVK